MPLHHNKIIDFLSRPNQISLLSMKALILLTTTLSILTSSVAALPRPDTTIIILDGAPSYPRTEYLDAPISGTISPNSAQEALNELSENTRRK